MDRKEKNRYVMFKAVEEVLLESKETVSSTPALSLVFKDFQKLLKEIPEVDNKYKLVSEGAAATKEKAEDDLIDALLAVAGVVHIFARRNDDEQLKIMTRLTNSGLKKMRDADLLQKAKAIAVLVEENLQKLNKFGLERDILKDLQMKIDDYENASDSKDAKFGQSKAARQELTEIFEQANEILNEELDTVMDFVKTKDTSLYNDYHATRLIKDV
ncbi:MAG: hypothetical protein HRT47_09400 [Candidatus Caenarcaniphilales bacterium]|nr:hypothetical protein [Candidatus Caenarcaniphilales bacterium]